jgi:uncharacterized protein (DUF3820 family)
MTDIDNDSGTELVIDARGTSPEVAEGIANAVIERVEGKSVPAVFNPLDADPAQFSQALVQRQGNYDALREHLRNILVPGIDFGKLHIQRDCTQYNCQTPAHLSKDQLKDPGADKILGLLGLALAYDDVMNEYRAASLEGVTINDVIITARILNQHAVVIAEGSGAASVAKHKGDLSNTIKKAQKRARVDAVKRLPGVSALFDGDFFDSVIDTSDTHHPPPQSNAQREVDGPPPGPGQLLDVMPIGKFKGVTFRNLDFTYLQWIVKKLKDKPDIHHSATVELQRRGLQEDGTKAPPADLDDRASDDKVPENEAQAVPGASLPVQLTAFVKLIEDADSMATMRELTEPGMRLKNRLDAEGRHTLMAAFNKRVEELGQ